MLLLIEPDQASRSLRPRRAVHRCPARAASMGSPTGVPVPCASTYWTLSAAMPGVVERLAQHRGLRVGARHRDAAGAAVLIDRRAR